ncbi:hypothetical protein J2W21_000182 [Sinomonas atrocyanea]|nr:hypothetical protein [Sinomonas atrocyanea]
MITGTVEPNRPRAPPESANMSAAASAMPGNAMTTSRMRMAVSSAHLRLVAATAPRTAPMTTARATAPRPMMIETRAP